MVSSLSLKSDSALKTVKDDAAVGIDIADALDQTLNFTTSRIWRKFKVDLQQIKGKLGAPKNSTGNS